MNLKLSILVFLNLTLTFSCLSQENSATTLEGKWQVIDWTYISFVGRSLDKSERQGMDKDVNDLILDFKLSQNFSSNKPNTFEFLQDKKFVVNDFNEVIIENQYYSFLIKGDKYYFLLSNIMLQIEKIENYKGSKIKLKKLPVKYDKVKEILNREKETLGVVYDINKLDKPPRLKVAEFDDNCLIDCLYTSFNSNMKYYIDYSKTDKDISYFIEFVIDKTGNIINIDIKSKHNKPSDEIRITAKVSYGDEEDNKQHTKKVKFSETERSIVSSILDFEGRLMAGVKNGENVNTKLNLELRLVSK